jgi:uncharacterized protein YfaP (DUF2135 family)
MTIAILSKSTLKWAALVLIAGGIFVAGMWADYRRDSGAPGGEQTQVASDGAPGGRHISPAAEAHAAAASEGRIFITLENLQDQNEVRSEKVPVRGTTLPGAVLSINGATVPVDSDGTFETTLAVEPGPNFVEFVASDLQGVQASRVVAIVAVQ